MQLRVNIRTLAQKDEPTVAAKDQPIVPPAPSLSDAIIESRKQPKPAPVVRTPPEVK